MGKYLSLLLAIVLSLAGLGACGQKKVEIRNLEIDTTSMYTIRTEQVDVLISDSGQVKYRLISPLWLIYDESDPKYWLFPDGLRLEGFDSIQSSEIFIEADSAVHRVEQEEWVLYGNVRMHGTEGRRLYTPQLHWLKRERRFYSNDTTYFFTQGRELRGDHFSARDDLSSYSIYRSRGDFDYKDKPLSGADSFAPRDSLEGLPPSDLSR